MHSRTEHAMRVSEFYSPVSFIRVLMNARRNQPFWVLQIKRDDFKEYHIPAKSFDYQKIPFSKVVHLKFSWVSHEVQYRSSWHAGVLTTVNVRKFTTTWRFGDTSISNDNLRTKKFFRFWSVNVNYGGNFAKRKQSDAEFAGNRLLCMVIINIYSN